MHAEKRRRLLLSALTTKTLLIFSALLSMVSGPIIFSSSPAQADAPASAAGDALKPITDSMFDTPSGIYSKPTDSHSAASGLKLAPTATTGGGTAGAGTVSGAASTDLRLPSSLTSVTPAASGETINQPKHDSASHLQAEISKQASHQQENSSSADLANFERGIRTFTPTANSTVETPFGTVHVSANSFVVLVGTDKAVFIYDLHDSHPNAVTVSRGSQTYSLVPGWVAALTRADVENLESINSFPGVGYRKVSSKSIDAQTKIFQCEYNLQALCQSLVEFRQMLASRDPRIRKLVGGVVKNAALLSQMSYFGGRMQQQQEPYQYKLKRPANALGGDNTVSPGAVTDTAAADAAARAVAAIGARSH